MITEKDLHTGLQFKTVSGYDQIYTLDLNKIKTVTWINNNKFNSTDYLLKDICQYINQGSWIIINPINKIYELW